MINKKQIRIKALERRDSVPIDERKRLSCLIEQKLVSLSSYREAEAVLSYASFRSEVMTDRINQRIIADGKKLYLPKTYRDMHEIVFYRVYDPDTLTGGEYGIMEPPADVPFDESKYRTKVGSDNRVSRVLEQSADPSDVHVLVLMPGAAYDDNGNRIGYGGGYYDRFLSDHNCLINNTMMLAYSTQHVDTIPISDTDIRPAMILTEYGYLGNTN
ncbi:MAG: 5-formyltetrahydrofolate cyclo-ligase [Eubacterium sp.]|nr:5-formyltetrahydrofolate cyclo-ligase [Eubacterium sp.]